MHAIFTMAGDLRTRKETALLSSFTGMIFRAEATELRNQAIGAACCWPGQQSEKCRNVQGKLIIKASFFFSRIYL